MLGRPGSRGRLGSSAHSLWQFRASLPPLSLSCPLRRSWDNSYTCSHSWAPLMVPVIWVLFVTFKKMPLALSRWLWGESGDPSLQQESLRHPLPPLAPASVSSLFHRAFPLRLFPWLLTEALPGPSSCPSLGRGKSIMLHYCVLKRSSQPHSKLLRGTEFPFCAPNPPPLGEIQGRCSVVLVD